MKTILLAVIVIFVATGLALGQPPKQLEPDKGVRPCLQESGIEVTLRTTGAYLLGSTIGIGADSHIWAETPRAGKPSECEDTSEVVPRGNWRWQILSRPSQSTSQLTGTNEASVTLLLDQLGDYRIRATACAFDCEIELPNRKTLVVPPESREIVIRVLAILPPDKAPILPPFAKVFASSTDVSEHCAWGADNISAAWYTVKPWNGPKDYKLLEGRVIRSGVATTDNDFNHSSMDWNVDVEPDPRHRGLLNTRNNQSEIEVEWERDHLPEMHRPTPGDRISTIGYWIYDCGHGPKTEIHPPVLLAAHRPRAILLPPELAGSNAYVPGIVTDVWVNRRAGDVTSGCRFTGLHQQVDKTKPLFDPQGRPIVRCLPDTEGFSQNPIKTTYTFNIYLPPSPHSIMASLGKVVPPVPLYTNGCSPVGSQGAEPVCEVKEDGGVTYLKVSIDLRNFDLPTYSRRIVAGWAHAAPDNWGARNWNVLMTSLDISEHGDSTFKPKGDWRFWVNTNNGVSEWAKIFDGSDNANGIMNFDDEPWATGILNGKRTLGPSIVLFPNQSIRIGTSGFEEDWYYEDSIAPVSLNLFQRRVTNGQITANNGDAKYTMHYQVQPGTDIGPALLTAAARARFDAYVVTNNNLPEATTEGLSLLDRLFDGGFNRSKRPLGRRTDDEPEGKLLVTKMSVKQIRQLTTRAARENPVELAAFLTDLKRIVLRAKTPADKAEAHEFLTRMKIAISPALWRKHLLEVDLRALVIAK